MVEVTVTCGVTLQMSLLAAPEGGLLATHSLPKHHHPQILLYLSSSTLPTTCFRGRPLLLDRTKKVFQDKGDEGSLFKITIVKVNGNQPVHNEDRLARAPMIHHHCTVSGAG